MGYKLILLILCAMTVLASELKINVLNLHNESSVHNVYDKDILFTKSDKIKFTLSSDTSISLDIDYIYDDRQESLASIKLSQNQPQTYPSQEDEYLSFDKVGDVTFVFKNGDAVIEKLHFKYIDAKTNTSNKIQTLHSNAKYGIDPNTIISNQRGTKEIEAYNRLIKSTVVVETAKELGSGIVVSKDGKILTNYHVVKNHSLVDIAFKPNSKHATQPSKNSFFKAKVIKVEPLKDLALLQILDTQALHHLEPIELSNLDNVDIGEDIYTMGHPQKEFFTIGYGIVSQVRQNYSWNNNKADFVIQTQSATSKGNSGGPLLGEDYKLIGLNTFSNTEGQNLNFAISIKDIEEFLSKKEFQQIAIKSSNEIKNYKKLSLKKGIDTNNLPLTQYELDSNNNGVTDLLAIDVGDDGIYNYLLFDTDEDGKYDKKSYDKDGDGVYERTEIF